MALHYHVEVAMAKVQFQAFPSIPRLYRDCVITEKLDGTNALVYVGDDGVVMAGSRSRWITPVEDNHGFARWVQEHEDELRTLGPGYHYGEWWGHGINKRQYGLKEKRFSLFNTHRWAEERPACCHVVPVIYAGPFATHYVEETLADLRERGSYAVPGFMHPEGIVVYHVAARQAFKVTLENDHQPKGVQKDA